MEIVGQKYEKKEYYLPQVLLSARTLYQALDVALPKLDKASASAQGKVVMAVVEGDVHDIGKNIVKAMLTGTVLTIFDLGRDIPVKNIVDKAKAENAIIIATPTLMTPTLAGMKGDRENGQGRKPEAEDQDHHRRWRDLQGILQPDRKRWLGVRRQRSVQGRNRTSEGLKSLTIPNLFLSF